MSTLSHERLLELLRYDPETGDFYWLKTNSPRAIVGTRAGWLDSQTGYWKLNIDGKRYMAHRVAWFYMTGSWPNPTCDHADTNQSNNRWDNLREATPSQQRYNTKVRSDNKSGVKGVFWDRRHKKWSAELHTDRQKVRLGYFDDISQAREAIETLRSRMHGEFARAA